MKYIWKKTVSGMLATVMMLSGAAAIGAPNEIRVLVAGEQVTFDQPPVMRNDRVLVPLRAVGEALGCEVHWYENTQSIGIGREGNGLDDVVLKVGYPRVLSLTTNNVVTKVTEIDQPPIVENDRTLVPVRALAEAVGADVEWDETTQTVTVAPWKVNPDLEFQDGIATLRAGRYSSVYKEDGTLLLPGRYDDIVRCGDMLVTTNVSYVAMREELAVYDMSGNLLTEGKTDPYILYAFGYLTVGWEDWKEDGSLLRHYSVLDKTGKTVLEDVDEDTYKAFKKEHFPVDVVETFVGGEKSGLVRATVLTESGETRYGFLNADCTEVVIPCELEETRDIANGRVPFQIGGKWGYADTKGNTIVPPQYEDAGPFSGALAPVKSGGKWGFIDENGGERIAPAYDEFYCSGDTEINVEKDGKWGLIDAQGDIILPLQYDTLIFFSEDLAVMRDGEKYGYINRNGEWVIPARFDDCSPFSNGVSVVTHVINGEDGDTTEQYALIDKTGQIVTEFGKYYINAWRGISNGYISAGFPAYNSSGILGTDGTEIECHQLIWP